jgi:hypothetical protein
MIRPSPGERIGPAIDQLAIEQPLPDTFWESTVRDLPGAPARRLNRAWLPAAGAAALVLVGAFLVARSSHDGASGPAASPAASGTASSTPTVHYTTGLLSFDYPADWKVLGQTVDEHYIQLGPAFGIGAWEVPCSFTSTSVACRPPMSTVPAGGVVVQLREFSPPTAVPPTAPPGGALRSDGIIALDSETPTTSTWDLYPPRLTSANVTIYAPMITLSATYRAPDVELHRAEVQAMVASIVWSASP